METKNVATEFEKYPAYKDSGVEWLGMIPEEWGLKRLGGYFEERRVKVSDKDYAPLSVTKQGIVPQLDSAAKTNDGDNRKLAKKGDFVINSRSDRKGSSGIAKEDGSVSLINIVLKPIEIDRNYSNYLLKGYSFIEEFYRNGHGIVADLWTTRYDEMKNIKIPVPQIEEQTAIANFLDEKTAKIDRAIAQKERLIELLKERKQVIVQDAVTGKVNCLNWDLQDSPINGINATATPRPMKPSGVEWIGEIPEEWEVKKLKYLLSIKNGQDYKNVIAEFGYPVYGSGGHFAFSKEFLYDGEALLLGRKGTVDKPMYVNSKFWTVDTMFYAIVNKSNSTKFLYYVAQTIPFKLYSTSTALPSMTQSDLNNHIVAVPYLNEQINIVEYIEYQQSKLETAINNYHQQIEKLKEYKAVLIDSAVTGKIKVV